MRTFLGIPLRRAARRANRRKLSTRQRQEQHILNVKVRAEIATRQRMRAVSTWCSTLLALVGFSIGGWYGGREALRRFFWENPEYNLAAIDIRTDGPLSREQVLRAAGVREGQNIFSVNIAEARAGLMRVPQVERAEIQREFPDRLAIDIAERKPVAWLTGKIDDDPSTRDDSFLIDRAGVLIRPEKRVPAYFQLPVICGLNTSGFEAGETMSAPEIKAALDLLRLAGEAPAPTAARLGVRSIDVSKRYCMVVKNHRDVQITLGLDRLDAQLARLNVLLDHVETMQREIQTVNLLVQRNVPVTFVPLVIEPTAEEQEGAAVPPATGPAAHDAKAAASAGGRLAKTTPTTPVPTARTAEKPEKTKVAIRKATPVVAKKTSAPARKKYTSTSTTRSSRKTGARTSSASSNSPKPVRRATLASASTGNTTHAAPAAYSTSYRTRATGSVPRPPAGSYDSTSALSSASSSSTRVESAQLQTKPFFRSIFQFGR